MAEVESKQGESKHDKFVRLATQRVTNAVKKIELIGNLASSSYEYAPEEAEKIFAALQQAVDGVKGNFSKIKKADAGKFVL